MGASEKQRNLLSDGKRMRILKSSATQVGMFAIAAQFKAKPDKIATINDLDDALHLSKIFNQLLRGLDKRHSYFGITEWARTDEYGVFHRDPKAQLGKMIKLFEEEPRGCYRHIIPDVPVMQSGKEISLQKAVGVAVYDSIELLKIVQSDERLFDVSAIDPAALAGKVEVVDFMRNHWARTNQRGIPIKSLAASLEYHGTRCGWQKKFDISDHDSTGWHGSFARGGYIDRTGQQVGSIGSYDVATNIYGWTANSWVALVSREAVGPFKLVPFEGDIPLHSFKMKRNPYELTISGSIEQLDALVRLLQSLKH